MVRFKLGAFCLSWPYFGTGAFQAVQPSGGSYPRARRQVDCAFKAYHQLGARSCELMISRSRAHRFWAVLALEKVADRVCTDATNRAVEQPYSLCTPCQPTHELTDRSPLLCAEAQVRPASRGPAPGFTLVGPGLRRSLCWCYRVSARSD